MVHDSINVGDDTVIRRSVDSLFELLFGTPLGTPGALLLEFSKIPDIVAIVRMYSRGLAV